VARGQQADTSHTRWELGGSADVTNERWVEDTFDDTTFTGRRLTSSPEYRSAGVAALDLVRAFPRGGRLALRQEATAGDRLMRSFTRLEWRGLPREGWRAALAPEFDVRRDRSFGGDRREWRFRPDGRLRMTSADGSRTWDVLVGGDWFRTTGTSDVTSLDRNAGRAWLRGGFTPLLSPWEYEVGAGADVRAFPDSTSRDHVESHGALTVRRTLAAAGAATLDLQLDRRSTVYPTATTRDRFWSGRGDLSCFLPLHDRLTAELWASIDGYAYDRPDSAVYFDYQVWVARPALRWSLAGDWAVRVGPRLERMNAAAVPAERYTQVAGVLEFERLHAGDWWSLAPAAGWRAYDRSAATLSLDEPDLHSSYLFLEAEAFADLGLPGAVRVRLSGSGRYERHEDPSQDASSLYLSLDLRRRF